MYLVTAQRQYCIVIIVISGGCRFSRGRGAGAKLLFGILFANNCMKMRNIGLGGGRDQIRHRKLEKLYVSLNLDESERNWTVPRAPNPWISQWGRPRSIGSMWSSLASHSENELCCIKHGWGVYEQNRIVNSVRVHNWTGTWSLLVMKTYLRDLANIVSSALDPPTEYFHVRGKRSGVTIFLLKVRNDVSKPFQNVTKFDRWSNEIDDNQINLKCHQHMNC